MMTKYMLYAEAVEALRKKDCLRTLKPMIPMDGVFLLFEDEKMLNFCSHDYLGMGDNVQIKKNAIKYLLQHGLTTAMQPRGLYLRCQVELEQLVSSVLNRESTLFFPSRFEANATAIATLSQTASHLFVDEASHPSFFEGAKQGGAKMHVYPHQGLEQLEQLLEQHRNELGIIAVESIFSTTGSIANISQLITLANTFGHLLLVDDSHAFGITGVEGTGLACHREEVDIITGSLSKAVGAQGGFLSSSKTIRDYLTSHNPLQTRFFFPPPFIGAIEAAFDLIPQMEGERKQLEQRSHWLRSALRTFGFNLPKANTPLISLLCNNAQEAEKIRYGLERDRILVESAPCFYGQKSSPRVNLSLNICHTPDHFSRLIDALASLLKGGNS